VLAGAPVETAPTAQGTWRREVNVTMLHQPTPRTDLARWAEETAQVINMIGVKTVLVSDPFCPPSRSWLDSACTQRLSSSWRAEGQPIRWPPQSMICATAADFGVDRTTQSRADHPCQR
jgi:hypothetical protein